MQNSIESLNSVLFETLEKLQNDKIEVSKAKAIIETSTAIAKNVSLQLQAFKITKGQTQQPTALSAGKIYVTANSSNTYDQKTEFAKKLGFKDIPEAIDALGVYKFNKKFKEEFPV